MLKCGGRFHCAGIAFCEIRTFLRSHWDWRLESGVFGVLDVAVTLGFALQGVASKLCFRDTFQLKRRLWWMGVCSESVELIPKARGAVQILLKLTWYDIVSPPLYITIKGGGWPQM